MNEFTNFLNEWMSYDRVVGLYFIFNMLVQALPDPDEKSTVFYVFFFRFMHLVAGNLNVTRKVFK
jgi:hypothetical protein